MSALEDTETKDALEEQRIQRAISKDPSQKGKIVPARFKVAAPEEPIVEKKSPAKTPTGAVPAWKQRLLEQEQARKVAEEEEARRKAQLLGEILGDKSKSRPPETVEVVKATTYDSSSKPYVDQDQIDEKDRLEASRLERVVKKATSIKADPGANVSFGVRGPSTESDSYAVSVTVSASPAPAPATRYTNTTAQSSFSVSDISAAQPAQQSLPSVEDLLNDPALNPNPTPAPTYGNPSAESDLMIENRNVQAQMAIEDVGSKFEREWIDKQKNEQAEAVRQEEAEAAAAYDAEERKRLLEEREKERQAEIMRIRKEKEMKIKRAEEGLPEPDREPEREIDRSDKSLENSWSISLVFGNGLTPGSYEIRLHDNGLVEHRKRDLTTGKEVVEEKAKLANHQVATFNNVFKENWSTISEVRAARTANATRMNGDSVETVVYRLGLRSIKWVYQKGLPPPHFALVYTKVREFFTPFIVN